MSERRPNGAPLRAAVHLTGRDLGTMLLSLRGMPVGSRLQRIWRFGTERYPEKVARRLRAVNIAAWCAAVTTAIFVLKSPTDIDPLTVMAACGLAAVPLLHRLGSFAAATALVLIVYAHVARLTSLIGIGDGIWVAFLTAAPLSILLFGERQVVFAGVLTALGIALAVALRSILPLDTGYLPPAILTLNFGINFTLNATIVFFVVYYVSQSAARAEAALEQEHTRSESLLANILPIGVARRLKDDEVIADKFDAASVMFMDMAGFTARAADTSPEELVRFLNSVFTRLDELVLIHGLEKIKTTGDAYMVVAGLPEPRSDHAGTLADLALAIREALSNLTDPKGRSVPIRIGAASGPVVAGVVGTRRFFYDVWGDTVNTAARMEQTSEPGHIQVALETFELLRDRFELRERGWTDIRGKGKMRTWYLIGRKPVVSPD